MSSYWILNLFIVVELEISGGIGSQSFNCNSLFSSNWWWGKVYIPRLWVL